MSLANHVGTSGKGQDAGSWAVINIRSCPTFSGLGVLSNVGRLVWTSGLELGIYIADLTNSKTTTSSASVDVVHVETPTEFRTLEELENWKRYLLTYPLTATSFTDPHFTSTMASSKACSTMTDDINANIKALWPDKDIEIDYLTDDYVTFYADLLELRRDPCSHGGYSLQMIHCDVSGAKGMESATERLHMMIKQSLAKKLANEAGLADAKGKQ